LTPAHSDVSIARRDVLANVYYAGPDQAIVVGHLGGETLLRNAGTFELGRSEGTPPVVLPNVYVVEPDMLPAGVVALLGLADITALGISLDHVLLFPGCHWSTPCRRPSSRGLNVPFAAASVSALLRSAKFPLAGRLPRRGPARWNPKPHKDGMPLRLHGTNLILDMHF
jgi:hypothetical protein